VKSFSIFAVVLCVASPSVAENWPQWRGPNNDGVSSEKNLPAKWSDKDKVLWKLEMPGVGSSTPAIWGDKIFLTSQDSSDIVVICVGTNGKEIWKKVLDTSVAKKGRMGEANEVLASASPSTDGKHVWAFTGAGNLACYDVDGKEIWKFDVKKRYGQFLNQYGMHSTPALYKDRLYMQLLHDGGQTVVALDAADAKEVWKINRKSDGRAENLHSYASAMVWHKGDDGFLVVHGNDYTTAHSLKDGSEIWRVADLNPKASYNPTLRFVSTPLVTPDMIVIPTAKRGAVVAVRPDAKGTFGAKGKGEIWRMSKGTPDVPSPLLYDGLVYLCGEQGTLTAIDAKSGEIYYDQQRIHNAKYRASPVYVDGKVICTARDGVITVAQAGKEFKVLSENKMNDDITASPAISGGRIYLRTWKALYAIGE
jgi:outer membrane protein assembly factor BamB